MRNDMATIDIHDLSGKTVGSLELADEVFGAINEALLWEAVKHYRAGQRAGTHATKNRWRVSGSGKKLWKQKGTGRARIGSIRSPLWRHGATVHGVDASEVGKVKIRGVLVLGTVVAACLLLLTLQTRGQNSSAGDALALVTTPVQSGLARVNRGDQGGYNGFHYWILPAASRAIEVSTYLLASILPGRSPAAWKSSMFFW